MTQEQMRNLIDNDSDWIAVKRFDFSLRKLLDRYPDGVPNRVIAQALQMSEENIEEMYQKLLVKLRNKME